MSSPASSTKTMYVRLTPRWHPLRFHPVQSRLWKSPARFKTIHAGRRSGKTELAKRYLVLCLHDCLKNRREWTDPRFFAAGPVRDQTKRIFWGDLKRMIPESWRRRTYEGDLCIITKWGAEA